MIYKHIPELSPKDLHRFWGKVKKTGSCWEWQASLNKYGYGQFRINDKMYYAHRISYELFNDEISQGLQIDHLCRNRSCVNPKHIEVVTQQENIRRGDTGKHQSIKTHCPHGHEYLGDNLYIRSNGVRKCRVCDMEYRLKQKRQFIGVEINKEHFENAQRVITFAHR